MVRCNKVAGVTLIELLVVITIMMTMLGLVGGQIVSSVEKARAQTEVIMVFNVVKKASVKAFSSGNTIVLKFSANQYELMVEGTVEASKKFEFLLFEEQVLRIDRNGLPAQYYLETQVRGRLKTLDFRPFFSKFGFTQQGSSHGDE